MTKYKLLLFIGLLGATATAQTKATYGRCDVADHGNGIYYFDCTRQKFGQGLSQFRQLHPNLEIASVAADDDHLYGHTGGYFVVVKPQGPTCSPQSN